MESNRTEAERLLGIAEKLLQARDLTGSREFAVLAQETEPLLDGSDQILAVVDVLLASERRINNHHDWYGILQLDHRSDDLDLIKKQYRRMALLLHPDKNKYAFADQAFRLVAHAWAVLSDQTKKPLYDKELNLFFSKVDLSSQHQQQVKLPVRRTTTTTTTNTHHSSAGNRSSAAADDVAGNHGGGGSSEQDHHHHHQQQQQQNQRQRLQSFWTACPYCFVLYEYPRVYEDCCLRCQKCQRAFHAAMIPSLPPLVAGQEAYYCCWGFFPLGFVFGSSQNGGKASAPAPAAATGFPNWMPPMFQSAPQQQQQQESGRNGGLAPAKGNADGTRGRHGTVKVSDGSASELETVRRKRGRPRKNPVYS
ncbi:uncharacterized protein LOC107411690 [Ziziphus jujuba]|uniref:Uncharacterized protein LOC107411690 n=1 Tax=Ziziphus jujuba TaxID=326968 RepID=A0A6P3Z9R3_ZIZJJ|nr:uncharacterized protein LOC107411690 [Ziziphus jujuba]